MRWPRRERPGLRVLVTGASSGIGAAVSGLLASRGNHVVGSGRRAEGLALAPVGSLEAAVVADLTGPDSPREVIEKAVAQLGGLDVVVSCAGAGWQGQFSSMSPAEIDGLLDINLRAPLHLAHAAAPYLLASGGQLVLVGSIAGLVGVAEEVAYGTAKAGLRGLADGLRVEWARHGSAGGHTTVTLVSPGPVATPFFSRRNRPYSHTWPHPMPVARVARRIVRAIDHRQEDVLVPAWLGLAARLNGGLPRVYRLLAAAPWRLQRLPSG